MKTKPSKRNKPFATVTQGNVRVKIYRTESAVGYVSFQVADYTTGKRRFRTFSDDVAAKDEAQRIARQMAAGEVVASELKASERASYGRAIELLRDTGTSLELAADRYAEAVRILSDGSRLIEAAKFFVARNPDSLPSMTVEKVKDEMIATKEGRQKSARYVQDLHSRLSRFSNDFKVSIGDVTTRDVQLWLDRLKLSAQSYINYRRVIYSLFSFAEARGYIFKGSNPVEAVESIEVGDGDVQIYTPQEFSRLLNAASQEFRPCLAIGGFAGLRSAEIERLEWSNIDLAGGFITLDAGKAKTASRRVIPICPALSAWLASHSSAKGMIWKAGHDAFYDAQKDTAAATEVAADPQKDTKGVPALKWKTNALRHSYASYRLAQIGDDARVAQELGNSAAIVHRHYKQLAKPADAACWFAITPLMHSQATSLCLTANATAMF